MTKANETIAGLQEDIKKAGAEDIEGLKVEHEQNLYLNSELIKFMTNDSVCIK